MTLADLIGDTESIGRMDDDEFAGYWAALGTVVRIACRARAPEPEHKGELSCTSASTQIATPRRDWRRPAVAARTPFGFTAGLLREAGDG